MNIAREGDGSDRVAWIGRCALDPLTFLSSLRGGPFRRFSDPPHDWAGSPSPAQSRFRGRRSSCRPVASQDAPRGRPGGDEGAHARAQPTLAAQRERASAGTLLDVRAARGDAAESVAATVEEHCAVGHPRRQASADAHAPERDVQPRSSIASRPASSSTPSKLASGTVHHNAPLGARPAAFSTV
jgi:hypothetical protein